MSQHLLPGRRDGLTSMVIMVEQNAETVEVEAQQCVPMQMRSLSMGEPMPAIAERGPATAVAHIVPGSQVSP